MSLSAFSLSTLYDESLAFRCIQYMRFTPPPFFPPRYHHTNLTETSIQNNKLSTFITFSHTRSHIYTHTSALWFSSLVRSFIPLIPRPGTVWLSLFLYRLATTWSTEFPMRELTWTFILERNTKADDSFYFKVIVKAFDWKNIGSRSDID